MREVGLRYTQWTGRVEDYKGYVIVFVQLSEDVGGKSSSFQSV